MLRRLIVPVLVAAICAAASTNAFGQEELLAWWPFEGSAAEEAQKSPSELISPFHDINFSPRGVDGAALRLDGYSTWIEAELQGNVQVGGATLAGWVALQAYPTAEAAILAVHPRGNGEERLVLSIGRLGFGRLVMEKSGELYEVISPDRMPLGSWTHLAGSVSPGGLMRLWNDGVLVAEGQAPVLQEENLSLAPADVFLGRDPTQDAVAAIFQTGVINGSLDGVRLYSRALLQEEIASLADADPSEPLLGMPPERFAGDLHRPVYHPMPRSAWTNEPHGLIQHGGRWHMFFQMNPNGPYWGHIHWGHLSSADLVTWRQEPVALGPAPGIDSYGIWSGGTVIDGNRPAALYTAVDGVSARVGLAHAMGHLMRKWERSPHNPVIAGTPSGYLDFRDPFVWREDDGWSMIIGTGVPDQGGTVLLYRSTDLVSWELRGPILVGEEVSSGYFWEMPVLLPFGDRHILLITTVEREGPARGLYWIGRWTEGRFTPDHTEPRLQELFPGMLSPTVAADEHGRLVSIGVVPERRSSEAQLAAGWAQTFNLPRVVEPCGQPLRLCQYPEQALEHLRGQAEEVEARVIGGDASPRFEAITAEVELVIEPGEAHEFGLAIRRSPDGAETTEILYRPEEQVLVLDRTKSSLDEEVVRDRIEAPLELASGEPLQLRIFIDHSVVDIFANGGRAATVRIYPTLEASTGIEPVARGGTAHLVRMTVWQMQAKL